MKKKLIFLLSGIVVFFILILIICNLVVLNKYYKETNKKYLIENINLKNKVYDYKDSLHIVKSIVDSMLKQLESADFIRYKIWKKTDILVPFHFPDNYLLKIWNDANEKKIPIEILIRLLYRESAFNRRALSSAGAYGYFQLMPMTYKDYNTKELKGIPYSEKNIIIGMNYLIYLYDFWKERKPNYKERYIWKLVLASYNSGLKTVMTYDGVPPIQETKDYINFIMK
jgi:hypothetical protein